MLYYVMSYFSLQTCLLDILDTAGQEEYSVLRDQYTREGDCFLIVYGIENPQSFQEAESLYTFLKTVKGIDNPACVSQLLPCGPCSEKKLFS